MEKRNTKEHAETKVVANCDQLTNTEDATLQSIQNCILTIRGKQVMLDRDLAQLYGVETKYWLTRNLLEAGIKNCDSEEEVYFPCDLECLPKKQDGFGVKRIKQ